MDFETYKRKLLEEDEHKRLSELQTKYNGVGTPDYANMSLRDELQTRFDLDELNNLEQKYGVQQTPVLKPQITVSSQQPNHQPQNSFWQQAYDKINQVADKFANNTEGAAIAFAQGLSGNNFDELAGTAGAAITTGSAYPNSQNVAAYNHIRNDIRAKHTDFKEKHPQLDEALEIGGTIYGGIKKPFISAVLYGVGSAETAEQIPEEITYNALGNRYVQKIPTDILPQKVAPIAKEYLSRIIPEKLKKYINK